MAKATENLKAPKLVTASARHLHIAPRKMRLVTNAVKNMRAADALAQLAHMNKKGAPMMFKLISSAIANAKNNFSLDPETLFVKSVTTDMGKAMKRYFPRARGSAFVIRRKMSHVNVVLESRAVSGKKKSFGLFKKEDKEKDEVKPVAQGAEASQTAKEEPKKTRTVKTNEQKKMSTVQNKRRLFNRKSGE